MRMIPLITAAMLLLPVPVLAQQTADSESRTPTTGDVSAGTFGSGTSTEDSVAVSGGAEAAATNGGTATSESTARFNNNTARQRSTATARDDDERARSSTMTHVRKDGQVRSRSMSIYKERGEKPVINRDVSTSKAPTPN